ncbi:MAG: GntR family transcriptional regulator [Proteobacteria bacterium]|nr:GntR family transcriptional regulator [Pseudomonadota bacterium]
MKFTAAATLSEQITDYLSEKIIKLELKPGERIIETKLAEELGTSKAPVREALRILEKKKLVKITPRKGASVTEITLDHIEWIADIFIELLGLAGYKCVENGTREDFRNIDAFVSKGEICAKNKDVPGYFDTLLSFALTCLKTARNPILEELIYDLMPVPLRILFASATMRADELSDNFEIVKTGNQHIQAGNAKMAAKTAKKWAIQEKNIALKIVGQMVAKDSSK